MCSRQIRPPIYSLKQTKLRKRRVVRYAILYFCMFVLFFALIVGPAIAAKYGVFNGVGDPASSLHLLQPTNWYNNDTRGRTPTGAGADVGGASGAPAASSQAGGGGGGGGNGFPTFNTHFRRQAMFTYAL